MDTKTKINTVISIVLVTLIAGVTYWAQIPAKDLKAELIDTDTVLVRIQDFAFDPDVVRIEPETTVSWLHDESEGNADVQHAVSSYDPEDVSAQGDVFESDLMTLGDTYSFTFNDPGVYYYNCSLHPFMTVKICVGVVSVDLDPDCKIEGADTATDTEDDSVSDTTADTTTDTIADTEDDTTTDTTTDTDLLPAADDDFEIPEDATTVVTVPEPESTPTTVTEPVVTSTQTTTDDTTELASSGPEDVFYLFAAMFALFVGHELARNRA